MVMVSVLAMFDISKAKDKLGNEIEINDEYSTHGMLTYEYFFIWQNSTYIINLIVIKNLLNAQLNLDLPLLENWSRT